MPENFWNQPIESFFIKDSNKKQEGKIDKKFEKELIEGKYLGMLESYGIKWDLEKVARDTLQNFFDANDGTLDGIEMEEEIVQDGDNKRYKIKIIGDSEYDYRPLLHIGGTNKEDNIATAGGFGEGAKVLSLVLLRDYGFTDVKFASKGWELQYYLDDLPKGQYDKPIRGLHARIRKDNKLNGSFVEFITEIPENIEIFSKSKDLFYNSENEDFKDPTFESKSGYGFKFLGYNKDKKKINYGHLYDAGQRRHYDDSTKGWDMVEGVNIWSTKKVFANDRDRGSVSVYEVEKNIINPMVEEIPVDKIEEIIRGFEDIWQSGRAWSYHACYKILDKIVNKAEQNKIKLDFDKKYLATSGIFFQDIESRLEQQGYIICDSFMKKIGMTSVKEKFLELQEHIRVEASEEELRRIDLLNQCIKIFRQELELGLNEKQKEIIPRDIWIYNKENENSIIEGQYNGDFVWVSQEVINGDFTEALAVYLHELDHCFGSDESKEFSYALTDTLKVVMKMMLKYHELFVQIENQWEQNQAYEKIEKAHVQEL